MNTLPWAFGVVACPWCGAARIGADSAAPNGRCSSCDRAWGCQGSVLTWAGAAAEGSRRNLWTLALRQLSPTSSYLSPLRHFSDWRLERFYRRTLDDILLAKRWAAHYLAGLALSPGCAVLEFGCGRGRHVALLNQLGFRVAAQDLQPHQWWSHLSSCGFQVVPTSARRLPWLQSTFAAVLDVMVLHHLSMSQVQDLAREVFRVLSPGGYWIMVEANASSYGAAATRRHHGGRLHTLADIRAAARDAGFSDVDHSYEGFYAPIAPTLVNFIRKQAWPGPLTVDDFDSRLAALVPPERRALWLLRVRKPGIEPPR
ncbi:MAG: class I SAM-dependent methyltransferase [Pirellulales bacterium]